ncbi:MAG: CNNM domain-containing protein [Planctomycetota bacterium]
MILEMAWLFLGCGGAVLLAGFYAGFETSAYATSMVRLRRRAEGGSQDAARVLRLLGDPAALVTLTLIGHNLAVYLGTHILRQYLAGFYWPHAEFWATMILAPVFFLFAETSPKQIGYLLADAYCMAGARIMALSGIFFLPFSFLLNGVGRMWRVLLRWLGRMPLEASRREEMMACFALRAEDGMLTPTQQTMTNHILAIERLAVRQVMTPLARVAAAAPDARAGEVAALMRQSGRKRIPLLDRRTQRISGILSAMAILLADPLPEAPALALAEPPVTLEASLLIGQALSRLHRAQKRLGVVVSGDVAVGVVSIADLLAELAGAEEAA